MKRISLILVGLSAVLTGCSAPTSLSLRDGETYTRLGYPGFFGSHSWKTVETILVEPAGDGGSVCDFLFREGRFPSRETEKRFEMAVRPSHFSRQNGGLFCRYFLQRVPTWEEDERGGVSTNILVEVQFNSLRQMAEYYINIRHSEEVMVHLIGAAPGGGATGTRFEETRPVRLVGFPSNFVPIINDDVMELEEFGLSTDPTAYAGKPGYAELEKDLQQFKGELEKMKGELEKTKKKSTTRKAVVTDALAKIRVLEKDLKEGKKQVSQLKDELKKLRKIISP